MDDTRALVPVVDVERDPMLDLDSCERILLSEGFDQEQVDGWIYVTVRMSAGALRMLVSRCKN